LIEPNYQLLAISELVLEKQKHELVAFLLLSHAIIQFE
jgi:hypothetical protein